MPKEKKTTETPKQNKKEKPVTYGKEAPVKEPKNPKQPDRYEVK